ncbi:MAG: iron-sulfur protein [Deltaproteobacteria bacterium]|nr:iron-sulfur protein [Deltaproteobacteria bacterium]
MDFENMNPVKNPKESRSNGLSYQQLLDTDSREVPDVLRMQSSRDLPFVRVPIDRYTSQAFHDLEFEKIWKKVWQFACREEQIPEVGDHQIYDIGKLSILIVRGQDAIIRAFHNTCLHRGRALKDRPGRSLQLQCPFHGWTWNLDGSLKQIPCRWDFDHVKNEKTSLTEIKVGTWGGFVFINPDPNAEAFEDYIGDLPSHFERWPLEERYIAAHVGRIMECNWKVAQEGFMEAYHVASTHPQMLSAIGDANSQYDAWDHFSRAITANMTPSPHLRKKPSEQEQLDAMMGVSLDGKPSMTVPEQRTARQTLGQLSRMQLQGLVPSVQDLSDAELSDSIYYTLFPNFHPWGAYNRITYRFRPLGNSPNQSLMEVFYLAPFRGKRPDPHPFQLLNAHASWTEAPQLGSLAKVFDQDTLNMAAVQKGLHAAGHQEVTFSQYQETKIRHFHSLLDQYVKS